MADPSDSGFIFSVAGTAEQCKENQRRKDTKVTHEGCGARFSVNQRKRRHLAARSGAIRGGTISLGYGCIVAVMSALAIFALTEPRWEITTP